MTNTDTKCTNISCVGEIVRLVVEAPKATVCARTYLLSSCISHLLLCFSVLWISPGNLMGCCIPFLLFLPSCWIQVNFPTCGCVSVLLFFSIHDMKYVYIYKLIDLIDGSK